MKRGLIVVNAYCNLPSMLNQSARLKQEFEKLGVEITVLKNGYDLYLDENGEITGDDCNYDFCVYLDKDKYFAELLKRKGLRLFNDITPIITCDDKTATYVELSGNGINFPTTFYAPLNYTNSEITYDELNKVADVLGFPLIVKLSYSSLGKGVFKVDDIKEFYEVANKYKNSAKLYQRYVKSSSGKDVRIICVGKKYLCSMLRYSETDFRSNAELGGKSKKFNPPQQFIDVAEKVANLLNLDYMGIDLLFGENGEPVLCEVNSNAFFGVMEKVSGVNVAKAYVNYILSEIYREG